VLERVHQGGYASDLLLYESAKLNSRDAGLASELVFGCLRRQAQLDWLIDRHTNNRKLDFEVRIALRIGIYQLVHLDRVPPHAAVSESVELVKKMRKTSASGLVNAVLRKLVHGKTDAWPSRHVARSVPPWLLDRWDAQFGVEVADNIAKEFLQQPDTWVRNPPADVSGVDLEPSPDVAGAWRVVRGDTAGLRIQDIGSQSIVPLLDLRPGLTFLDLCSAPGNKTAQAMEAGVTAVACDLHLHRLQHSVASGCPRVVLDARCPLPFRQQFDRILVDAPCTGTGTLARNPEIRWRLKPEDIADLQSRQIAILTRALSQLKPHDGVLVYSTCSLEREENEDVIAAVLAADPEVNLVKAVRRTPGVDPGDGFYAAVLMRLPHHQAE
jgi:16S rRNA (cytosine967-C5)-methyltransferase